MLIFIRDANHDPNYFMCTGHELDCRGSSSVNMDVIFKNVV